jgi:hypothetical protein
MERLLLRLPLDRERFLDDLMCLYLFQLSWCHWDAGHAMVRQSGLSGWTLQLAPAVAVIPAVFVSSEGEPRGHGLMSIPHPLPLCNHGFPGKTRANWPLCGVFRRGWRKYRAN